MEERKFKVGDRVKAINDNPWDGVGGKLGTVINVEESYVTVEFDDYLGSHDGSGSDFKGGKMGHCLFTRHDEVELVPPYKFKVGDRVKCKGIKYCEDRTKNKIGTVICIELRKDDDPDYGIQFDEDVNGHSCGDAGINGQCLWAIEEEIELVPDEPKEESTYEFKVGDRVKCKGIIGFEDVTTDKIGTVVSVKEFFYFIGVEFDTHVSGHDCLEKGRDGYCLWANSDDLELVPEKSLDYIKPPVRSAVYTPDIMPVENDTKPAPVKITKFLYIEDGSVDVDELTECLAVSNPEIKIIVYRQGSQMPKLVEVYDE